MRPLQIFRAGTHTDSSSRTIVFTVADVMATARSYNPDLHEAPLVVGHPQTDDPAYGFVETLRCNGAALEANPRAVEPAFADMVNAERFNKISASFFLPDAPNNPVSGVYYLRHVGFLGAAAPAVKGLRKPQFSAESSGVVTVSFALPPLERPTGVLTMTESVLSEARFSPDFIDRFGRDIQGTAHSMGKPMSFDEARHIAHARCSNFGQSNDHKFSPRTHSDDEQAAIERLAKILMDIAKRDGKELSQAEAIAQATAKVRRQPL